MTDKIGLGNFCLVPIGMIQREEDEVVIKISEAYLPALKQLEQFSHVMVFWWADHFDNEEARRTLTSIPPYAPEHECGLFATRAPYRPNPIMMTTCKLSDVDEELGIVKVLEIDAFDGTAVIDLKAYFPVCDRVQEATIPAWLSDWPDWMPEEGIGLEEYEKEGQSLLEHLEL